MTSHVRSVGLALLLIGLAEAANAQPINGSAPAAGANAIETIWPATQWQSHLQPVELRLSRVPLATEGRLGLVIGGVDVSQLLSITGETVRYLPNRFPLPSGSIEAIAYLVSPAGAWQEIGRSPIKVLTPSGFEEATAKPTFDVGFKSQFKEGHSPATTEPNPRATFNDFTLQGAIETRAVRNGLTWTNQASIVGSSYQAEALRFAQLAAAAPEVDLSGYLIQLGSGRSSASLGHVMLGTSKHLVTQFASRGVSGTIKLGRQADVTAAMLNATTIVGWDNLAGVANGEHRVYTGTLGVELVPGRPGGVRIEGSFLSGSALPQAAFNQAAITDAQESTGAGLRIVASDARKWVQVDGGYTRSRFVNPADPLLSQGTTLVAVREESKDARYLDATFALLPDRPMGKTRRASVALVARHEQVDPLFKSLGASQVRSDLFQNQLKVQTLLGLATIEAAHTRFEDNIDDLASALKTLTRQNVVNAMLPLASFTATGKAAWAPRVIFSLDRTHQFGDHLPVNADFAASHVPDQQSHNHSVGLDWTIAMTRVAYKWNRSLQDNRQVGRERADLENQVHVFGAGVVPKVGYDVAVETAFERARNVESGRIDHTKRLGVTAMAPITPAIMLQGLFSSNWTRDEARTAAGHNSQIDIQGSWQFRVAPAPRKKPSARVFLKYGRLIGEADTLTLPVTLNRRSNWNLNAGLTLSVF